MKKIILFSFFILSIGLVGAQSTYQTHIFNAALNSLPQGVRDELQEKDTASYRLEKYPLKFYLYHRLPGINTLGVRIFPNPFYRFFQEDILKSVERELAYFLLLPADEWESYAKTQGIYFYGPDGHSKARDEEVLEVIHSPKSINVSQVGSKYTIILTNDGGRKISISFPGSYTFITGLDRLKLQEILLAKIRQYHYTGVRFKKDTIHLEQRGNLWVYEGNNFLIPQLKYIVYYDKHKKLIYNPALYPRESLSNLLLTSLSERHDRMVKVYYYSYRGKQTFDISLKKFLGFFGPEFEKYFGIEEYKDHLVRGTLILHNPALSYIHMVDFHFSSEGKNDEGNLVAYMYAYIPQDEIKTFFGVDGKPGNR